MTNETKTRAQYEAFVVAFEQFMERWFLELYPNDSLDSPNGVQPNWGRAGKDTNTTGV